MSPAKRWTIFHHIPKTGGTSAQAVFRHWFRLVRDYVDPARPQAFLDHPVDLDILGPDDMLCGHFCAPGSRLGERYPRLLRSEGLRLVTLLRDPLDTMISLYHYERRVGFLSPDTSLVEYLSIQPDNPMASYLPCTERDYEEVLRRYTFIGLTEHIQDSLDYLADQFAKPRILVPHANAHLGTRELLPADAARQFRERNALDYAIYQHAVEHFPPALLPYQMT
ncbi:MAG TPA: hypothetical protein VF179_25385 [Thermoanaerobaculia bacterium]|nr:hypothetical protein [Thermoanaerobaculia bacterium]